MKDNIRQLLSQQCDRPGAQPVTINIHTKKRETDASSRYVGHVGLLTPTTSIIPAWGKAGFADEAPRLFNQTDQSANGAIQAIWRRPTVLVSGVPLVEWDMILVQPKIVESRRWRY